MRSIHEAQGIEIHVDTVGERIRTETEGRIAYFAKYPEKIGRRLEQLENEWTIERALEIGGASVTLLGVALAAFRGEKRWLVFPAAAAAALLQHATSGSTPPARVLRRLCVRRAKEVEQERYALELLRGDYESYGALAPELDPRPDAT